MAPAKITNSFLPELRAFAANIASAPYEQLLPAAAEAGWQYATQQIEATGQADGTVLVTFQVLVGKEDRLEPYDLLSVKVAPGPGPVTAVARRIALESLVPLFFGRYPAAVQPVQHTVQADDRDIVIPDADEDQQEYVPGTLPALEVVDHLEPDGVPIFTDLYSLGARSADVIEAVLDEVENFLARAQSVETINAMGSKNPMMIKFLKDLGDAGDIEKFMKLVNDRRTLVAPPVLSNARRRVAAEKAN